MSEPITIPALAPAQADFFWFMGPDAVRFLNDLVSQEVAAAPIGSVRRSLLLTPQGKMQFLMWLLRGEARVGVMVEDGLGDSLVETLRRYLIRVDVEIAESADPVALVVGEGVEQGRWKESDGSLVADVSWAGLRRALVVGDIPTLPVLEGDEYTSLRIRAGEPVMGRDVDENTIPQETGLVPASVSFEKGCFLGQELVARLDSRGGRVNRHLRILEVDGTAGVGSAVTKDGEPVGEVSSAADGLALALLHRRVEAGDEVQVGGLTAHVRPVPENPET
ncbi:MAG: hypothetical protein WA726_04620 [Acidimicrobiia bacterium]